MMRMYAVPKHSIPAEVALQGLESLQVTLFLSERAPTHSGTELPSDVLNGEVSFIPAKDAGGQTLMLNKDALLVVSLDADQEYGHEPHYAEEHAAGGLSTRAIQVSLSDGSTRQGTVTYLLPEASRRIQDYLNVNERFLALRDDRTVHFINKRHITHVRAI